MKSFLAAITALGAALCLTLSFPALAQDEWHHDPEAAAEEAETTVNVNEADAETLAERLKGIGLRKAEAIVEYRERYGPFYSPEELTAVRGIGRRTVNKNLDRIRVD